MTLITFEDGKPLMKEDGTIGSEQACCCNVCGTNCTETITVDVSVAGYETQLVFTVAEGSAFYSEAGEGPFDFFDVSAFLFCSIVDGVPTWALSVSVCWAAGANFGSEQYDGTVVAGPDGCPPDGAIPLAVTFGNGDATVSASVA